MPTKIKKCWPAFLATAFLLILSSIPAKKIPSSLPPGSDKVVHALLYSTTGFAYRLSFSSPLTATLGIALMGAADENYQRLTPGRSCSLADWIADLIGGILGVSIAHRYASRRNC